MSEKKKATDDDVYAFIAAVYPSDKVLHEWQDGVLPYRVVERYGSVLAQFQLFEIWRDAFLYEGAPEIARLAAENERLRKCVEALLWPNVPSADDVALLIRMTSGASSASADAMVLAENLRLAQDAARKALERKP